MQYNEKLLNSKRNRYCQEVKRNSARVFFLVNYNMPPELYDQNESMLIRLLFSTINLENVGVDPNPEMDLAIDEFFRKKPNKKNTILILSHPVIQGLWQNSWNGPAESFSRSQQYSSVVSSTCRKHTDQVTKHLSKLGIVTSVYF